MTAAGVLTEQQWVEARSAAMAAIPAEVQAAGLPAVLLPYQARTVKLLDSACPVLFVEKSRRIGLTPLRLRSFGQAMKCGYPSLVRHD